MNNLLDRHTGLVCYEREFFYGGDGINSCSPVSSIIEIYILLLNFPLFFEIILILCAGSLKGGTILGSPDEVIDLGDTEITQDVFMDYLSGIGQQDFR